MEQVPERSRLSPAPYARWGNNLGQRSVEQLENACRLPVAVRAALMPDAHPGYGLPIGGVLATRDSVIPYAVGVDIACRVRMTVFDLPTDSLDRRASLLEGALEDETRFGIGSSFRKRRSHSVLDHDWNVSPVTTKLRDKAWAQLGTSGSGNHFVEFGRLEVTDGALPIERGSYLALLSHSGSRGSGAAVAAHYSRLAKELHPDLAGELANLAWLDLREEAGKEYWDAMELMGHYAAANHECIHEAITRHLGAEPLWHLENHHNFAWREVHDGEEVVVHRKGATPAHTGTLGIVPGSMATPTYLVRGLGNEASLHSAAHGAGRRMSRRQAKKTLSWDEAERQLSAQRVRVLSAGLDEVPAVYKDIEAVMRAQAELVQSVGSFQPRIVKMAPAGERPED